LGKAGGNYEGKRQKEKGKSGEIGHLKLPGMTPGLFSYFFLLPFYYYLF
jgi:hypothetical protein